MTVEITVEVAGPYADMLHELRENSETDVDDDLRTLLEDSIHDGYQTVIGLEE
jgi:hypothetical protein